MKSGRVYEVAGRLKRRMDDVLEALKEMGADVTSYSSLVDDEYIGRLAASYGKEIKLPFIPDIPVVELDGQKQPILPANLVEVMGRILDSADDSLKVVADCDDKVALKNAIKLISNESKAVYTVKKNIQLYVIPQQTKNERYCRFRLDRQLMINGLINPEGCMVLAVIGSRIFCEPATFAVLDDVWYLDAYKLIADKGVSYEGQLNPRFAGKFSSYKKAVMAVGGGFATQVKDGPSYDVDVRMDPVKLPISGGLINEITWSTGNEKYTIRGNAAVKTKLTQFLQGADGEENKALEVLLGGLTEAMGSGADVPEFDIQANLYDEDAELKAAELAAKEAAKAAEEAAKVAEETAKAAEESEEAVSEEAVCEVLAEETNALETEAELFEESKEASVASEAEEAEAEPKDTAAASEAEPTEPEYEEFEEDWEPWMIAGSKEEEAYLRLCTMVQAGLAPMASREFMRYGSIFYSQGSSGQLYSLEENDWLADIVAYFEERYEAVAFYGIITDTDKGQLLNIFYVTEERSQWEAERQRLDSFAPTVYIENLDNPELSTFGDIRYRMVGEGTVRED